MGFSPLYCKAARLALDAGLSVRFASIDCYYSLNLCNERGIRGVPVIKYFNGKEFDDTPWAHGNGGHILSINTKNSEPFKFLPRPKIVMTLFHACVFSLFLGSA